MEALLGMDNDTAMFATQNETFLANSSAFNDVIIVQNKHVVQSGTSEVFESKLIIPLYVIIFVLSVVGNLLVLITLAQNKRMRTVTNIYLLNLAISDILLGVFCMPFTLVGQVLRNFIFGATMCKLIPFFQAVSVSVGVCTLVAISLERYFAICRPLKSRRWQTQFHAYKMITIVWMASLIWNSPIFFVSKLKPMKTQNGFKCREEWPNALSEQAYNLFLDAVLLLIPLMVMVLAYSLIMFKLWKGMRQEIKHNNTYQQSGKPLRNSSMKRMANVHTTNSVGNGEADVSLLTSTTTIKQNKNETENGNAIRDVELSLIKEKKHIKQWIKNSFLRVDFKNKYSQPYIETSSVSNSIKSRNNNLISRRYPLIPESQKQELEDSFSEGPTSSSILIENAYKLNRPGIRSNYMDKSIEAKRKVIRMLFVIVAEFFICWTPVHVLNTWYLFAPELVYSYVGSTGVALIHLLAYISSCCNPITYCFMNKKFRQAFLSVFDCKTCVPVALNYPATKETAKFAALPRPILWDYVWKIFVTILLIPPAIWASRVKLVALKLLFWKLRIVFSSGYNYSTSDSAYSTGTGLSGSVTSTVSYQRLSLLRLPVFEAASDGDESFKYRISWSSRNSKSNGGQQPTSSILKKNKNLYS